MSTFPAAVVSLAVLAAAGAGPAWALAGPRWVTVPLAPLAGALLAALSATATLAVGGAVVVWFVVLALVALAAAVAHHRRPGRPQPLETPDAPHPPAPADQGSAGRRWVGTAGGLVVLAAAAWSLLPLRVPTVGFDARTTWLLHAVWFSEGHGAALAALRNPALSLAHTAYPPLIGGSVAVAWKVTGNHSYVLGVVVVALLNAAATAAAAAVVVDVGRRCGDAVAATGARRDAPGGRPGAAVVPELAGVVAAGLLVLVAFGVAGPFATNGYADMLWAMAAVGAVGFALVLPGTGRDLGAAVLLLGVADLTKDEGTATAVAIALLWTARATWRARPLAGAGAPPGVAAWRALAAGAAGVVALMAWPALTRALGAAPDVAVSGPRRGDDASRAHLTYDAMAGHLHVLVVAVPVAVVGGIVLRRARRAAGVGNDGWAWAALAAGALAVAVAYVTGSGTPTFWLATSVHRTTMFPALAAWWIVGVWAVVATAPGADRPATDALDGERRAVLHHRV